MSDWTFLNDHRVQRAPFRSSAADGFNGAFEFECHGRPIRVIASDGLGWKHVSVSQAGSHKPPNWDVMAAVKDLFWEPEDWVVQFHPARSEYVNNHPGCLHLWQPTEAVLPTPPAELTGVKNMGTITKSTRHLAVSAFIKANK